jgi:hypothetical protein
MINLSSSDTSLFDGINNASNQDDTDDCDDEVQKLQEKARKLREEIEAFERMKSDMEEQERQQKQQYLDEQQAMIDQYSVMLPILKPDGTTVEEIIQFPPRLEKLDTVQEGSSTIFTVEATLPLGVLLGEHETLAGIIQVDEVVPGSNGDIAGIQEGDLLRACTACKMEMVKKDRIINFFGGFVVLAFHLPSHASSHPFFSQDQPTWQLLAGGIGRPKTFRYSFSVDGKPFEQVMDAVGSNRFDPQGRPILLVLERTKVTD